MVVLLERNAKHFPGAPGRQGPGRLSFFRVVSSPGRSFRSRSPDMTSTVTAEETIANARERIDALDDRIIGLVQERMAVSAVVQETRIASGGRRVNLSREMEILGRYREALGKPGTPLAMTLLELCRGRV
ncbi:chorismate mutase [Streptomyces sp. NPDC001851]|uniref:chorismate mutase n=1 Tax=Streptomyces sp. NPDC001851 TaxID=3154529 RepID=UPI0033266CB0